LTREIEREEEEERRKEKRERGRERKEGREKEGKREIRNDLPKETDLKVSCSELLDEREIDLKNPWTALQACCIIEEDVSGVALTGDSDDATPTSIGSTLVLFC
jgi:hypothetical protein